MCEAPERCTCGHARSSHDWRLHSCRTCWRQVDRGERDIDAACCRFNAGRRPAPLLGSTTVTKVNSTGGLSSFTTRRYPGDEPERNG